MSKRALRLKAAETRESMSQLVNDALRVRRGEGTIGYEELLKQLRADGTI